MKRFTKGCLITALILFIIGAVFCATFGMMGGFRQINSVSREFFDARFSFLNDYIWEFDDWDEERWAEMNNISSTVNAEQTNYGINDISDISIELGGENLIISESDDDYVWIRNNTGHNRVKYGIDGSTFKLSSRKRVRFWSEISKGSIYLYLPKGMTLDSIDLEMGAGKLDSDALSADKISMEIGAGEFSIEGISANEVNINIGAGKMNIDAVDAVEADISVGAGSVSIKGMDAEDASLEVGMGSLDLKGKISGNADVECGMGNISMVLRGDESEHNYNLDCAMGNIQIGKTSYTGLASERIIDNGSSSQFDVECAMGNISIKFE